MRVMTLVVALAALAPPATALDVSIDLRGGWSHLTQASNSAQAVLGARGGSVWGGAAGVIVKDHFGITLSARRFSETGERVFVADPAAPVFPLGHPVSLKLTPVLLSLSYRFRPDAAFTPYAGLGGGRVSFEEVSSVAGVTERESASHREFHALAGLEFGPGRLRAGVELQYSTIPNAIGIGGVSALYGEDNLGGFSVLGRLIFIIGR